jgi:hypothetical protein
MPLALPSYRWRLVHLTALWGYGVSQPVFSMLDANPEFLVVRGSTRADVVAFSALIAFGIPLIVVLAEAFASRASVAFAEGIHIAAIVGGGFLASLQIIRNVDPVSGWWLMAAVPAGVAAAIAYGRVRAIRSILSLSIALPLIGLGAFVATVPLAIDDHVGLDVEVARPVPIVLVVFDEFPLSSLLRPDGSIDTKRYPSFGRLASEGTWYSRATTVHDATTHAVPAVLTGKLPEDGNLPTLAYHPDNVFTLLGETYTIRALEQVTRLCPSRYCPRTRSQLGLVDRQRGLFYDVYAAYRHQVMPRSMRGGLPAIGERWGGFGENEGDVRERVLGALDADAWLRAAARARGHKDIEFERLIRSVRPRGARPTLYFHHSLLPHSPWTFLPSGRRYANSTTVEGISDDWKRWGSSAWLVDQALQRLLLQVGYTDRIVGRLLERLDATRLYDDALIIVTADHGINIDTNGSRRDVTEENVADIAAIPLFVKYPGQRRGRVDGRVAKTIDILPTIAEVIGARAPWVLDGRSLLAARVARDVTVMREGGVVASDSDAVQSGVLEAARRNAALFGVGGSSMYRLGPYRQLVGRSLSEFEELRLEDAEVQIEDEGAYANVRLDSPTVPARIVGQIRRPSLEHGAPLAVAVNGRIAAMTRAFTAYGQTRFAALVSEQQFRSGHNVVTIYAVERSGSRFRLARLGGTPTEPSPGLIEAQSNLASNAGAARDVQAAP